MGLVVVVVVYCMIIIIIYIYSHADILPAATRHYNRPPPSFSPCFFRPPRGFAQTRSTHHIYTFILYIYILLLLYYLRRYTLHARARTGKYHADDGPRMQCIYASIISHRRRLLPLPFRGGTQKRSL